MFANGLWVKFVIMNKKLVTAIIVLMAIVLTGMVLIQFYWINKALVLREQQFHYNVYEAMDVAVKKMEREQALELMTNRYSYPGLKLGTSPAGKKLTSLSPDPAKTFTPFNVNFTSLIGAEEEEKEEAKEPKTEEIQSPELLASNTNFAASNSNSIDLMPEIDITIDTFVKLDTIDNNITYYSNINFRMEDCVSTYEVKGNNRSDLIVSLNNSAFAFQRKKDAFNDLFFDFIQGEEPTTSKVDRTTLENYLSDELNKRGITTPYEYTVKSSYGKSMAKSVGFQEEPELQVHRMTLFPGDIFADPSYLYVYFPNQRSFILSSLGTMSFTSIILILIVSLCFAYTIHIIFRQKKLSDMKTDFINNMTHELKTPVATISLASEMLKDDAILENKAKLSRYAGVIHDENKRLGGQVEKVLQMAVIDKGDLKLKTERINVHELIDRVVDQLALQIENRGGKLQCHLDAQQTIIDADDVHITNIIFNLLDNAIKYSTEQLDISVSTRNVKGGIAISVSDKGIGMNKEQQRRVFERFYRVPTGNIHNVKGFGLGLSYVKAMVEAHGGSIKVISELQKGSTFEIYMPQNNLN